MHNSQLDISTNYTFTKASHETLARIYLEIKKWSDHEYWMGRILHLLQSDHSSIGNEIMHMMRGYNGKYVHELKVSQYHNKVPDLYLAQLAKQLGNQGTDFTMIANYVALGSGTATPSANDAALDAEIVRGPFTSRSSTDGITYLDKFFSTSEVGGNTFNESGIFIDGTSSIDSGLLMSRVAISEVVGAREAMTLNATITFSSAT